MELGILVVALIDGAVVPLLPTQTVGFAIFYLTQEGPIVELLLLELSALQLRPARFILVVYVVDGA